MASVEKTSRLFNFLTWLLQSGESGISIDYIIKEYDISKKTFLRDLKELNKISNIIEVNYDKENQRIYSHIHLAGVNQLNRKTSPHRSKK